MCIAFLMHRKVLCIAHNFSGQNLIKKLELHIIRRKKILPHCFRMCFLILWKNDCQYCSIACYVSIHANSWKSSRGIFANDIFHVYKFVTFSRMNIICGFFVCYKNLFNISKQTNKYESKRFIFHLLPYLHLRKTNWF